VLHGHTIYFVACKEAQICHPNVHGLILLLYLNYRHAGQSLLKIVWILLLKLVQKEIIDKMDDL
jgi:hypothetical protein